MEHSVPFWERSEQVNAFANRPPDERLLELLRAYPAPAQTRVLDLGCAGGRNTVVLAEQGFDFFALDGSIVMVEHTRQRVAALLGEAEAIKRVMHGAIDDLRPLGSQWFHLVVALGVYHNVVRRAEWDRALSETARVLAIDGLVLVANFSPRSDPGGNGLRRVPGEQHVYEGFEAGPVFLLEAAELDAEMARWELHPVVPTRTVVVQKEIGRRVTVNALYRKAGG